MDFKSLANPWVIGGGALLGLVLLMSRGGGAAPGANYGATLTSMELSNDITKAGMALVATQAQIAAMVATKNAEIDAQLHLGTMATFNNVLSANAMRSQQVAESNAGIFQSMIAGRAALALERQAGATRMAMATIEADTTLKSLALENGINIFQKQAKQTTKNSQSRSLVGLSTSPIMGI